MNKKNLLENILAESKAYEGFKDIERLVEVGSDLSVLPVQPLYISLLSAPASQVALILPKLSQEQRQALIDLDFWNKDIVDVDAFEYWLEAYALSKDDELIHNFVQSDDFLLYLKSRVALHTFDAEDPMYPDHDYYFLTDDGLLLVEYGDGFKYPGELKYYIRELYNCFGVEGAYTKLFKLINDSFPLIQEDAYIEKKERLREFGFVDYFEAREKLFPFVTYPQLNRFIKEKKSATGSIHTHAQNQSLHSSALVGFNTNIEFMAQELSKVHDEKRKIFLQFTFVRLINSGITLSDALKKGRMELNRVADHSKAYIELAIQYIKTQREFENEVLFDIFDFFDLYKVGCSLVSIVQKKVTKTLKSNGFDQDDKTYFLGPWWNTYIESSFKNIPEVKNYGVGLHPQSIMNLDVYYFWKNQGNLLCDSLPFIKSFYDTIEALIKNEKIQDQYYLNYDCSQIDYESILISTFINSIYHPDNQISQLGIKVTDFQKFITTYFNQVKKEYLMLRSDEKVVKEALVDFCVKFGFDSVNGFQDYVYGITTEHLNGYEFDTLAHEDYKHVGGPIFILSSCALFETLNKSD